MYSSSITADEQKSIVLYPQGTLQTEFARDNVAKMLIFCGADPMRHIDHAYTGLDEDQAFARYLKYISRFDEVELCRAVVLLHKTESIPYGILKPRQILMQMLPQLTSALWCVYLDIERDPFAIRNLMTVGKIYGLEKKEQVFVDYRNNIYLLLRSDCDSPEALRRNTAQVRKTTNSFVDREIPTARATKASETRLTREDFLGNNTRSATGDSYPPPSESSVSVPIQKTPRTVTDTSYRFCSEYPTKTKLGSG
ncbi:MAG: hypothetical protein P1P90_00715 [Patescibacteria group bacterium]|nr:hypothetical protein [Patescibacteria group bacterium]